MALCGKAVRSNFRTGKRQSAVTAPGLSKGGDPVRIGFGDSLYLANGDVTEHNRRLAGETVRIAKLSG